MNSIFISKVIFLIFFLFIFSCQNNFKNLNNINDINDNTEIKIENTDTLDFTSYEEKENYSIDYYTKKPTNFNFSDSKLNKFKINNFQNKYDNILPLNVIFDNNSIYSVNYKGDLLKFDSITGKLIEKYKIKVNSKNKTPVSFSLINNYFIIGFKSGEIIKIDQFGNIVWSFKKNNYLNTPIKHFNNQLIILYPEDLIILSEKEGEILFEKNYQSKNKIIQSSGGKIINYFNIIYFILPNSEFNSIDTFLYDENYTNLNKIKITTPLNNLNDQIHIYKNLFVYLDNGIIINTYNLIKNEYLLSNFRVNNLNSYALVNNFLINKNKESIEFFNIKNGNLFSQLNIKNLLKEESKIVEAIIINGKLHLFFNSGKLLIINNNLSIENTIDLKIRNINKVYTYQDKIFISTEKGITYIF